MKRFEEALQACDQSVHHRQTPVAGMFVDPRKLSHALNTRGGSHMQDHNYDEVAPVLCPASAATYAAETARRHPLQASVSSSVSVRCVAVRCARASG
eukprot:381250-Rhodomonas_salina.2